MKKFLLSFLTALVFFSSFVPNLLVAQAQEETEDPQKAEGEWYNQSFDQWYDKVYNVETSAPSEIFGERYTAAQVQWVVYGIFAFILNSTTNAEAMSCIMKNATKLTACQSFFEGMIGGKNIPVVAGVNNKDDRNLTELVFAHRPFSGISYTKSIAEKFKLVPEVQAQERVGFGFEALEVVQKMWRASRDIAFGLFVIAAVVFAFMVMFRVKISPQAIITVQSAIPQLIIALVLVTFSYAIAGFLIDLMYIFYGILSLVATSFFPSSEANSIFQFLTAGRIGIAEIGVDTGIFGLLVLYIILFSFAFGVTLWTVLGTIPTVLLAALSIAAAYFIPIVGQITIILGVVIFIIVALIIIINCLKIVFALLKAYVNILLLTIFAPIQIVAGVVVPSFGFSSWLRSFASNLAVFVVTSALLFFSFVFMIFGFTTGLESMGIGGSLPEYIGGFLFGSSIATAFTELATPSSWPPLLGAAGILVGGATSINGLLFLGVSFVLFTLIPKANEIIQGILSGRPFAYGTGVGEAWGVARWVGGQAYDKTGAKDIWELIQIARKGRLMDEKIGAGGDYREAALKLIGGDRTKAKNSIDGLVQNYRSKSGADTS